MADTSRSNVLAALLLVCVLSAAMIAIDPCGSEVGSAMTRNRRSTMVPKTILTGLDRPPPDSRPATRWGCRLPLRPTRLGATRGGEEVPRTERSTLPAPQEQDLNGPPEI